MLAKHPAAASGILAPQFRRERRIAKMGPAGSAQAASSLEEELLRMLARQARRIPVPVFLATLMIAALASGRVPAWVVAGWLVLVAVVLAIRWWALGHLAEAGGSAALRVRAAIALSAMNGVTHALALGFFPFLPEFERALQSMVMIAMCAGAVATTAGYMPVLLAYLLPVLVPLSALWAVSPGIAQSGWIETFTAVLTALFGVLLVALGRDAFRLFRESFDIRLQHKAALEQAEAANRAKTRFLASASHDLRQPIHTLSLFGAALSMRPLDEATRGIAQNINSALQVLTTQLDALLDISKLDAGVVRVNPEVIALGAFLERMRGEFEPAAREKGLGLPLECPAAALVETDPVLLGRIVRNLLDNAIKYTSRGAVAMRVEAEAGGWGLTVSDTGRGIQESDQDRVFEEFYQVDNPERDRTKGLGLGLAIVRRLAGLLRIRLEMDSAPGEGTSFRLALPGARRSAQPPAEAGEPGVAALAAHVLVVDDESGIRLGMKALLEAMGCRATLVDCTEHAVEAARNARPDLVLADFRLRGADNGIATVRAIRALYPGIPAILVSGDIAAERLREAQEAGIALLHKPVPPETLKKAIAEAVEA